MTTAPQPTWAPTRKVAAAGISGALTTVALMAARFADIEISGEEAAAIVAVAMFGAGWIFEERV